MHFPTICLHLTEASSSRGHVQGGVGGGGGASSSTGKGRGGKGQGQRPTRNAAAVATARVTATPARMHAVRNALRVAAAATAPDSSDEEQAALAAAEAAADSSDDEASQPQPSSSRAAGRRLQRVDDSSEDEQEGGEGGGGNEELGLGPEGMHGRPSCIAHLTPEERDIVESFVVPDGFVRVAKPAVLPRNVLGWHVLMRFARTRRSRRDGGHVITQWCEWSLGKVVKLRTVAGLVDIMWDDVGKRTSKLNLDEYGGGEADGPIPTWVFCQKV